MRLFYIIQVWLASASPRAPGGLGGRRAIFAKISQDEVCNLKATIPVQAIVFAMDNLEVFATEDAGKAAGCQLLLCRDDNAGNFSTSVLVKGLRQKGLRRGQGE